MRRIAGKIFAGPELGRIHENRGHGQPALPPRGLDQAGVAGVQGAHGRHQADRAARRAGLGHTLPQLVSGRNQFDCHAVGSSRPTYAIAATAAVSSAQAVSGSAADSRRTGPTMPSKISDRALDTLLKPQADIRLIGAWKATQQHDQFGSHDRALHGPVPRHELLLRGRIQSVQIPAGVAEPLPNPKITHHQRGLGRPAGWGQESRALCQ